MTIKRIIDGKEHTIELTSAELCDAFFAQQAKFDRQDIEDELTYYDDEELEAFYGLDKETIMSLLDDMADRMRRYIDKYEYDWRSARDDAIWDITSEYKESHGID